MMSDDSRPEEQKSSESKPSERKPLVSHQHRKRSVTQWLVPLVLIIAIMVFLPKILALLE